MDKVIRDGKVAVLVSPGYGAGWYSWARYPRALPVLFDPDVIAWVENGKNGDVPDMKTKHQLHNFFDGGAADLMIEWVPVGAKFRIDEYDGNETLILETEEEWVVA